MIGLHLEVSAVSQSDVPPLSFRGGQVGLWGLASCRIESKLFVFFSSKQAGFQRCDPVQE